ncbi:MAG: PIN domain-containing protein [Variovorax sp.]
MSVVTLAELRRGVSQRGDDTGRVAASIDRLLTFMPLLAFDAGAAIEYGELYQAVRDRRRDALDRLIAAHAIASACVLVTNKEADFRDYPGLAVENCVAPA